MEAARQARDAATEVTLWAGVTQSALPTSRRLIGTDGRAEFRPNPDGVVCDALPICLLKTLDGDPLCLLFSVSCHPSMFGGFEISAEYPGVAMDRIDAYLGRTVSLFLQGTGGDAKPSVTAEGKRRWRAATWEDVVRAGNMVANEVIHALEGGLAAVEPQVRACSIETSWPLQAGIGRAGYEALLAGGEADLTKRLWAEEQLACLDRGYSLPESVPITVQGIQLGKGVRIVGLEGEAVAGLGHLILAHYSQGVAFPLGYTNGAQLYLPTSPMLDEGGYEAESYYEYRQPAPLAKGMEAILATALKQLSARGIM